VNCKLCFRTPRSIKQVEIISGRTKLQLQDVSELSDICHVKTWNDNPTTVATPVDRHFTNLCAGGGSREAECIDSIFRVERKGELGTSYKTSVRTR
jgi:hypothetical protein